MKLKNNYEPLLVDDEMAANITKQQLRLTAKHNIDYSRAAVLRLLISEGLKIVEKRK